MQARTTDELRKIQTRTVSLMQVLMRRVGASNAHQFSGWLNDETKDWGWPDTQESKKWYPFVRGNIKREPNGALALLSQLFPDAADLYRHGPSRIWSALWGSLGEQIMIMREQPNCLPHAPLENVLKKIEMIAINGCGDESQFEVFVRAIALYSYIVATDPYGRIGDGDGFGRASIAYGRIKDYLREPTIVDELNALGIYDALCRFLADIELNRVISRPQWVTFIECGETDERLQAEIEAVRRTTWDRWKNHPTLAKYLSKDL
ncbi:hypothetical protein [Burkholderia diffusa]|uniref:hypothetical protein n=1 Tax=Burkholderia diffusa TaxID=488732 RepID=UPI002AB110DE|nr:hypothetical protein [Burkholderia diffusa]